MIWYSGSKTSNLSPSVDAQLRNILRCCLKALKNLKWLRGYTSKTNADGSTKKEAIPVVIIDGVQVHYIYIYREREREKEIQWIVEIHKWIFTVQALEEEERENFLKLFRPNRGWSMWRRTRRRWRSSSSVWESSHAEYVLFILNDCPLKDTHTHTHTHIYIYIYILTWLFLLPQVVRKHRGHVVFVTDNIVSSQQLRGSEFFFISPSFHFLIIYFIIIVFWLFTDLFFERNKQKYYIYIYIYI